MGRFFIAGSVYAINLDFHCQLRRVASIAFTVAISLPATVLPSLPRSEQSSLLMLMLIEQENIISSCAMINTGTPQSSSQFLRATYVRDTLHKQGRTAATLNKQPHSIITAEVLTSHSFNVQMGGQQNSGRCTFV